MSVLRIAGTEASPEAAATTRTLCLATPAASPTQLNTADAVSAGEERFFGPFAAVEIDKLRGQISITCNGVTSIVPGMKHCREI